MTTRALHHLAFKALPYMVAAILALGGGMGGLVVYIVSDFKDATGESAKRIEDKLDAALSQIHGLQIDQAFDQSRLKEIERRLNSRKSPINDVRDGYWLP